MSLLYVSEFQGLAQTGQSDSVPILAVPAITSYTVVVSAGSSGGPLLNPLTQFVEVSADTTCSFRVDTSGGGVSLTDTRLAANERMIRRVIYNQQPYGPGSGNPVVSTRYAIFTTANV